MEDLRSSGCDTDGWGYTPIYKVNKEEGEGRHGTKMFEVAAKPRKLLAIGTLHRKKEDPLGYHCQSWMTSVCNGSRKMEMVKVAASEERYYSF